MRQITKDEPKYFSVAKSKVKLPKIKEAWEDKNISQIRPKLREYILAKEQNNLCVYCEKKITSNPKYSNTDHFKTRNLFSELTLNYSNLFVSCCTGKNQKATDIKMARCSTYKDSKIQTKEQYENIINPSFEDPRYFFDYLLSGEIIAINEKAKFTIEILNLNQQSLCDERKILADTLKYCTTLSIEEIFENFGYEFQSFIQNIYPKLKEI